MSSTKNNRIKRLIAKNLNHPRTAEVHSPRQPRVMTHTVTIKNKDTGDLTKQKTQITIIDNTYGRTERRATEAKRLANAIGKFHAISGQPAGVGYYETPGKKERMGKFAHKKDSRAKKAEAKNNAKKSKGMKKGG